MAEKYIVTRREVWTQDYEVEADSERDAKIAVENGLGQILEDNFDYSHVLPNEDTVRISDGIRLDLLRARHIINEESPYAPFVGGYKGKESIIVDCGYEDVKVEDALEVIVKLIGREKYNINSSGNFITIKLLK